LCDECAQKRSRPARPFWSGGSEVVSLAGALGWAERNRRWLAILVALIVPWVWLVGLDRMLRRTRWVYGGHAAIALGAKAKRPSVPLALLVPVAFGPDWIEWFFTAFGHRNQEISHSLVSVGIVATLVARVDGATRQDWPGARAVGVTSAAHWPADFFTGRKPTWPGGPTIGLYAYARPLLDFELEVATIIVCWIAYEQSLPPESRHRSIRYLVPLGLVAMHIAFLYATSPVLRP
jgi:hypothetical protein